MKIKDFNVETIANSGQIFRFYKRKDKKDELFVYDLYVLDKHLIIKTKDYYNYEFSCSKKEFNNFYKKYFDLSFDYNKISKIVKSNDKYLKKCISYGKGLKLLKQDPYEMLISFIISQRKSIPAIRTSIERLCKYCGKKIKEGKNSYYIFPKAIEILKSKDKLKFCGLGYRLPYIIDACEKVISKEIRLYDNKDIDTEYLMKIKGVGIKVASCVMLFAYGDLSICPIDVWMKRVLDKNYDGVMPEAYRKYAGIIQQYLFNFAKDNKEK